MKKGRRIYPPAEERFWAKVDRRGDDECWLWVGGKGGSGKGYGIFRVEGRRDRPRTTSAAHIFSYELLVGPTSPGHHLHHLIEEGVCTSTLCVNPRHLEPLTPAEYVRRGTAGFASLNAKKERCPKGHPLSGKNLLLVRRAGGRAARVCRACARDGRKKLR